MCSSHATVRGLLHDLAALIDDVVVDSEASPEHLSRATVEAVDTHLVVAEPYFKSLETARRYTRLGEDLGIPNVSVVANKVLTQDDHDAIGSFCATHDMALIATIPFDEALGKAEREGVAPLDYNAAADSVAAVEGIVEGLLERTTGRET
jgi:CO dehydrogenase maturation factor